MCGIFGFSNTTPTTDLMVGPLALMMEMRGKDSWGVTDGNTILKRNGAISDTFIPFVGDGLDGLTYHCRGASQGMGMGQENAHPFEWLAPNRTPKGFPTGVRVVGMHNGHISNHAMLKAKYDNRKGIQVDSQHIFAQIADGLPLEELDGWAGSVVWWEMPIGHPDERIRYISSFGQTSLAVARLQSGEIVFASTWGAIDVASKFAGAKIKHYYKIETNHVYTIGLDADGVSYELKEGGVLPWAKSPLAAPRVQVITSHHGWPDFSRGTGSEFGSRGYNEMVIPGFCAIWKCQRKVNRNMVICDSCRAHRTRHGDGNGANYGLVV